MINTKMIARIMGSLFFIEAGFLILCSFLAVYYNESDLSAFLYFYSNYSRGRHHSLSEPAKMQKRRSVAVTDMLL